MGAYRETEVEVEESTTGEEFAHALREQGRVLPIAVRRDDDVVPFHAGIPLRAGDRVVVLRRDARKEELPAAFRRIIRESPVLDLEGPLSADEFFEQAASKLTEGATEAERLALLEALRDREAAGSTVLAPGIAVPHIAVPVPGALPFLIARCRDGIMFPDEDEPVRSAFVLVRGAAGRGFHLQALAAIATAARRDDFDERWMAARDADELRKTLL